MARALFISTGLSTGGAEVVLGRLVSSLIGRGHACAVVSLTGDGSVGPVLESVGAPVEHVELRRATGWTELTGRLQRVVRIFRPEVIQGWMYHGNVLAHLARRMDRRLPPPILGIRQCVYDLAREKRATRWVIRCDARLSERAFATTYVSDLARSQHVALGYSAGNAVVIGNGIDLDGWPHRDDVQAAVRARLNLQPGDFVIGHVARYHPVKDHAGFLRAVAPIARARPKTRVLMIGAGVEAGNRELENCIADVGLAGQVQLLGERPDVPELMCCMDVFCSSSQSEGFPNVVVEAMAGGAVCVVTDVGDSGVIVGSTGRAVPPGSTAALIAALDDVSRLAPEALHRLGALARQRVGDFYSIRSTASAYEALYDRAIGTRDS